MDIDFSLDMVVAELMPCDLGIKNQLFVKIAQTGNSRLLV